MEKKVYTTGGDLGTFGDTMDWALNKMVATSNKAAKENAAKDATTGTKAPATETPITTTALPDLNDIEVAPVEVPKYDREKKDQTRNEADGTRQWAEAAGEKMVQLEKNIEKLDVEIKKIERDPNSKFSSTAQSLLTQLKASRENEKGKLNQLLSVGNEAAKAHMKFSALHAEIHGTDPNHLGEVRAIIDHVVETGRYRLATEAEVKTAKAPEGKWPRDTVFFEGKVYFATGELVDGRPTDGRKALAAELRTLTEAAKLSKAASIKTRGNVDLTDFPKGKPGKYYFFGPKRTKKNDKTGEQYQVGEGHALIEVVNNNEGKMFYDKDKGKKVPSKPFMVVYVRDAIGSMAKWLEKKERYIPFNWIEQKKVMTSRDNPLPQDEYKRAQSIIWTLRELYEIWDDARKEALGRINAVAPADMTGVIVEKVVPTTHIPTDTPLLPAPEAAPETPAPEKKLRKAKKTSAEKAE